MKFHYEVRHNNFEGNYNLIYTDTDFFVYDIRHHDIYERISQHREHFDLSDSKRPGLQDDTNKKTSGKFKDETNSLVIKEFIALSPKSYAYSYQTLEERTETSKKHKCVNKTVIKKGPQNRRLLGDPQDQQGSPERCSQHQIVEPSAVYTQSAEDSPNIVLRQMHFTK